MKLEKLGPVGPKKFTVSSFTLRLYSESGSRNCFLCLGGRLRLSGITRVTAGAMAELRATRRASLPISMTFFFRFFIRGSSGIVAQLVVKHICKSMRRVAGDEANWTAHRAAFTLSIAPIVISLSEGIGYFLAEKDWE